LLADGGSTELRQSSVNGLGRRADRGEGFLKFARIRTDAYY
jgi:hypothetical protein